MYIIQSKYQIMENIDKDKTRGYKNYINDKIEEKKQRELYQHLWGTSIHHLNNVKCSAKCSINCGVKCNKDIEFWNKLNAGNIATKKKLLKEKISETNEKVHINLLADVAGYNSPHPNYKYHQNSPYTKKEVCRKVARKNLKDAIHNNDNPEYIFFKDNARKLF